MKIYIYLPIRLFGVGSKIVIPVVPLKRDSRYQKEKKRKLYGFSKKSDYSNNLAIGLTYNLRKPFFKGRLFNIIK